MNNSNCRCLRAETVATPLSLLSSLACRLAAGAIIIANVQPATADEIADFYKGRTLTIVVGHEVGSGFDVYARTLQRHLSRHLAGNPNVVVQNMNGASGLTAANWLFNIAPRDGTVISTFVYSVPIEALMGNPAAKFEPAKFTWIGNMEESVGVCGVSKAADIAKFDDMLTKESIFGATAAAGPFAKASLTLRNLLGVKLKLVSGYKGSADMKLAIGRGEVHGICGLPMSTITSFWREEYENGNFRPIVQLSGGRQEAVKNLPHVNEYAKSEQDRQVLELVLGTQALGRLYASPPGIPTARKEALRAALSATMKDPEFLADAAKTKIDISPMSGAAVETFIARLSSVPSVVVERAKQAYAP